ncbi:hypothetical protein IJ472_06370 [bacterium]|nr:hypothetical protein [bacterium]
MVKILDCTIRDSGFETNWNFEDEFVFDLMRELNEKAVNLIEIGYRNHIDTEGKGRFYNCTPNFLKPFYEKKGNLKLGVMVDTTRFSTEDFPAIEKDYIDFVRIAGRSEKISETLEIAEILHNKGYKIYLQLMDISNVDANGYLKLYAWEHKDIIESVYFADSKGTLQPDEISSYFYKLKTLGYHNISFHAHNASNLALKNSLKAIELGVTSIDISHISGGRNGGNLTAEEYFNYTF